MDIEPNARILTLASTNDAATLDKAAIRTGRFDSIVEVGYPNSTQAARILSVLINEIPGGQTIDIATVVAALPENTSGSDLREVVRRAVLAPVTRKHQYRDVAIRSRHRAIPGPVVVRDVPVTSHRDSIPELS